MIKRLRHIFIALFAALVFLYSDAAAAGGSDIAFERNIDLSKYLSTSMCVNLHDIKWRDSKIYVALQYLDNKTMEPAANSRILELDESGNVLREFESRFQNVYQIIFLGDNILVVDKGSWYDVGGGITKIDLLSETKTVLFDAKTEGRSPIKMEFVSNDEGYIMTVGSKFNDQKIAKFSLDDDVMTLDYGEIPTPSITSMSYNSATNTLWFANNNRRVYKYSLSENGVEYNISVTQPVTEIVSVGDVTLTVESNYTAGNYGLLVSDKYTKESTIDGDAGAYFADGNFYILERGGSGKLVFLSGEGEIIRQLPFDSKFFNPHGVCGNKKGNIFVGSKEDLTLAVFALEGFQPPEDPDDPDPDTTDVAIVKSKPVYAKFGITLESAVVSDAARINVKVPKTSQVTLAVFDVLGNVVFKTVGKSTETFVWNLKNEAGGNVANGTYLALVEAKGIDGKVYTYSTKIGVKR
ncbi:MAG: hypothetical protein LBH98_01630 [Chitinispirillales bacterium]|jgi:hypothetical protein|nr:hypothetical protein [Chitinispirillales bacterium]